MPTNELGPGYFAIEINGVDYEPEAQRKVREAFKRAVSVPSAQLKKPAKALPWTIYELIEPDTDPVER